MIITHHRTDPDAPLGLFIDVGRPEYQRPAGYTGKAVAARAELLREPAQRSLLWFLHHRLLAGGGRLPSMADELLAMFPEGLGTRTMHQLGMAGDRFYSLSESRKVRDELAFHYYTRFHKFPLADDGYHGEDRNRPNGYAAAVFLAYCRERYQQEAERYLVELCLKPASSWHPEELGGLACYHDMVSALIEYQRRCEAEAAAAFIPTIVSRSVWKALDKALLSRRILIIEGKPGRGTTKAVKAWCAAHTGVARYHTLSSTPGKVNTFLDISRSLDIPRGPKCTAHEMQSNIREVLGRSRLLLVIDQAELLFDLRPRLRSLPELVNWIYTDLYDHDVQVALVCSSRFMAGARQAARQLDWDFRRFQGRSFHVTLPEDNTEEDLKGVARALAPELPPTALAMAAGYAIMSKRDVSGVVDFLDAARLHAVVAGRSKPILADFQSASVALWKSDAAFSEPTRVTRQDSRKKQRLPAAAWDASRSHECDANESPAEPLPHGRAASAAASPERGGRLAGSARQRGQRALADAEESATLTFAGA